VAYAHIELEILMSLRSTTVQGGHTMITLRKEKQGARRAADQEASRLAAIRAIVELADNDEDHDVAAEALLVLGASRQEMCAAMLGVTD
jgi:hypothetical protein